METAALKEALEALHPASFSWAMSCCAYRREDAEEVLQISYLKVMDGRARYGGHSSLKTWFFAVIRKTAAQERRRAGLRRLQPGLPSSPDPAHDVEREQQRHRVRAALAKIARRQREVLELVFYHELTIEQAAAVMGVGLGSARVHYTRGKRAMLKQLEATA